jgi:hypothetical protein
MRADALDDLLSELGAAADRGEGAPQEGSPQ